ncbi:thiamine pyrophosphate-dependent dehydrogenase E1 component subunit alpha, partial [Sphingobacteriales bacterium CHB3]|nr:thiamine pyrophosphate-dependent dehydrogenase E1 component subunit alpha [Sphingobacteriales bacterium CHB3]
PMACGVALASKMRKENAVVINYIGDGGCNLGEFHDGMNMASVMKLPFIMIIENNQFAYSTPNHKQFAAKKLSDRAVGYGIPGFTIDGTDVELVYATCQQAVERARKGEGPTLIETVTMRMHGHSLSDDASYVPKGMVEEWRKKDPVELYEKKLKSASVLSDSLKKEMQEKILAEIQEAVDYAVAQPYPPGEQAVEGVFAE